MKIRDCSSINPKFRVTTQCQFSNSNLSSAKERHSSSFLQCMVTLLESQRNITATRRFLPEIEESLNMFVNSVLTYLFKHDPFAFTFVLLLSAFSLCKNHGHQKIQQQISLIHSKSLYPLAFFVLTSLSNPYLSKAFCNSLSFESSCSTPPLTFQLFSNMAERIYRVCHLYNSVSFLNKDATSNRLSSENLANQVAQFSLSEKLHGNITRKARQM